MANLSYKLTGHNDPPACLQQPSLLPYSGRAIHASLTEKGQQTAHFHLLGNFSLHSSDCLGVVRRLGSQLDSIVIILLRDVPELQADPFLLNLLDVEVTVAVILITDSRERLDGRKPVLEVIVDGVVEGMR